MATAENLNYWSTSAFLVTTGGLTCDSHGQVPARTRIMILSSTINSKLVTVSLEQTVYMKVMLTPPDSTQSGETYSIWSTS